MSWNSSNELRTIRTWWTIVDERQSRNYSWEIRLREFALPCTVADNIITYVWGEVLLAPRRARFTGFYIPWGIKALAMERTYSEISFRNKRPRPKSETEWPPRPDKTRGGPESSGRSFVAVKANMEITRKKGKKEEKRSMYSCNMHI